MRPYFVYIGLVTLHKLRLTQLNLMHEELSYSEITSGECHAYMMADVEGECPSLRARPPYLYPICYVFRNPYQVQRQISRDHVKWCVVALLLQNPGLLIRFCESIIELRLLKALCIAANSVWKHYSDPVRKRTKISWVNSATDPAILFCTHPYKTWFFILSY